MEKITGKSLDAILITVAEKKNVEPADLIYYILEEKPGFLGFGASVTAEVFSMQDVEDFIETYLNNFFEGLGMEVQLELDVKSNAVNINLSADNNAIIIGRNGRSLEGLNLVLRNVINSKFKRRFNVFVDVNHYKRDRYQKLKALAQRVGKSVQRTKVDVALDPMPNDERRMIHKELSTYPNIKTKSEGSGRDRHLRIIYVGKKE